MKHSWKHGKKMETMMKVNTKKHFFDQFEKRALTDFAARKTIIRQCAGKVLDLCNRLQCMAASYDACVGKNIDSFLAQTLSAAALIATLFVDAVTQEDEPGDRAEFIKQATALYDRVHTKNIKESGVN